MPVRPILQWPDKRLRSAAETIIAVNDETRLIWADILRPIWVEVTFLNSEGQPETHRFEDLEARSVQHQIDHLAGRMYFDHLSKTKRDMLLRKARKFQG